MFTKVIQLVSRDLIGDAGSSIQSKLRNDHDITFAVRIDQYLLDIRTKPQLNGHCKIHASVPILNVDRKC